MVVQAPFASEPHPRKLIVPRILHVFEKEGRPSNPKLVGNPLAANQLAEHRRYTSSDHQDLSAEKQRD